MHRTISWWQVAAILNPKRLADAQAVRIAAPVLTAAGARTVPAEEAAGYARRIRHL